MITRGNTQLNVESFVSGANLVTDSSLEPIYLGDKGFFFAFRVIDLYEGFPIDNPRYASLVLT
jgi:hypothetical protein